MASTLGLTTGATIVDSLQAMSTPFKSSSKSMGSSVKVSKDVQKVVKAEVSSPLEGMSKFFASIDKNIRTVAQKASDSLGVTTLMAKIMGKDLKLEEEQAARDKRKRSIGKAKSGEVEGESKPFGAGILASLKDAFENLVPRQTLGELGTILLLATGAAALIALASKFTKLLAPVLEFFFETLIPGFQELNRDILSSPTGYLGVGGLVISTTLLAQRYGNTIRVFFSNMGKSITTALKSFKTMMFPAGYFKTITTNFKKLTAPLTRIGTFIATLSKTVGSGAATVLAKLPGVAAIGNFGKMFVRFLGPVGLVIQAFVGLFTGISRSISTFKETGSITKTIGAFFGGLYDSIIGATLNLLTDLIGFVVKKLGFQGLGEKIQSLDFTVEGIFNGIKFVIEKIKNAFDAFVDSIKGAANAVIKIINKIPGVDIELFETKAIKKAQEEGIKGSEGTNTAESLAMDERAREQGNKKRVAAYTGVDTIQVNDMGESTKFDFKADKAKKLKMEEDRLATQKAQARTLGNINAVNNSKGATTVNQTSVHSSGEPSSDHSDLTSKHLASAFAV
jgi:hypothetical protein